jgi:hypothetical protein
MIFDGDPGVDRDVKPFVRLLYQRGANARSIWLIHDVLAAKLDKWGEDGMSLHNAVRLLVADLIQREIIEKQFYSRADLSEESD